MKCWFVFFAVFVLCHGQAFAQEQKLFLDLSDDQVEITTGFDGARVVMFGSRESDGDVVIVVRGPEYNTIVRRKSEMLGLWINRDAVRFRSVPAYYDYAVSRPEGDIASSELLKEHQIGLNALVFETDQALESFRKAQFQEALFRNKQAGGHYALEPKQIKFLGSTLFRTEFMFPASVPTGDYRVDSYLIKDGEVIEQHRRVLRIGQAGLGAFVFSFAYNDALLYAILSIMMALLFGWVADIIFRART